MSADPFGTAALRAGVLAAWRGSPTRFREDANAESDLVRGGYADRLLVELAQNAADAAHRAGAPGHLRLVLDGRELRAANTGAPLDEDGVAALAALRASAKRGTHAVGRFGVGFAAVLAVCDEPSVVSATGGVVFSAARTAAEVDGDAPLRAELARRDGRPPVLRLAWPVDGAPPQGFATEVRLPLRAGVDGAALLAAAAAEAPDLLLALPWLGRLDVGDRTWRRTGDDPVRVGDQRWRVVQRAGALPPHLLAGPEDAAGWTVTWALPVDADGAPAPLPADVLHAPTRTAERLTLPARLIAGVPVEPDRRRVAAGPAAKAVLAEAAAAYPALAGPLAPADRTALVPAAGFPASEVDGLLRDGVLAALRDAAWLPGVTGPVTPARAQVLDSALPELAALLADVAPGLLAAELAGPRHAAALAALDVPRLRPAALAELLAGLRRPPDWWHRCYAALAPLLDHDPSARDELGGLPVPLADGRTVTGPRGVLLGTSQVPDLPVGELRLVHPDAAHPLLERLGARPAGPDELLDALRPAVERSVADAEDGADVAPLAAAVLALAPRAAPRPWLGALALPDTDDEPRRADELVLPDGALRPLLAPDGPLGVCAAAAPREALRAVGVLDGFAVLDEPDPAGPDHDLDDEERWWSAIDGDARPPDRLLAVRDLDLVDDAAWPDALRLLAADPRTAAAVRQSRGYTGWWLARHSRLGGLPLRSWRLPSAPLDGLYDPVPVDGVADDLLAAAGVRADLAVDGAADAADLLARLADDRRRLTAAVVWAAHAALAAAAVAPRRGPPPPGGGGGARPRARGGPPPPPGAPPRAPRLGLTAAVVWAAHAALAAAAVDPADVDPPERVRAVTGGVVDADDALVLDRPELAAVLPTARTVAGGDPAALAELLDLPLASERVRAVLVDPAGRRVAWADLPEVVAACAALGRPVPDGVLVLHDELRVRTGDGEVAVPWWPGPDGTVHAADPVRALVAREWHGRR